MSSLQKELKNFRSRELKVSIPDIFPGFDLPDARAKFGQTIYKDYPRDPHQIILDEALGLWNKGYEHIIEQYGFHDQYKKFAGHCHQMTPALGVVLLLQGFEGITYLECFRADLKTGEKIDPIFEPNPEMREEFCGIERIPYCCLEVSIDDQLFYLSPKHIIEKDQVVSALLTPDCYQEMVGVFPHQLDKTKSGIYLAQVPDLPWIKGGEPFVWRKQKPGEEPELFRAYLRMPLTLK